MAGVAINQKGPVRAPFGLDMARPERFELPTTKFVAWYSIQLSYGRVVLKPWQFALRDNPAKTRKTKRGIIHRGPRKVNESLEVGGERGIRTLDGAFDPILP